MALPFEVQGAFAWAFDRILQNPTALPRAESRPIIETEPLAGSLELRRIKVKRDLEDPGFRGIYVVDAKGVVFLRFVFRDQATYKGLRTMAHRARSELGLE